MNESSEREIILSQWQTCVEMANSISQRRDTMNNIFITLNLALVTATSVVWDFKSVFMLISGIVVCILWILFIRNFKILNTEKFKVIMDLEKKLPMKPFESEWNLLCKNKKYKEGTQLEKILPIMFITLYTAALILLLILKIKSGGAVQ